MQRFKEQSSGLGKMPYIPKRATATQEEIAARQNHAQKQPTQRSSHQRAASRVGIHDERMPFQTDEAHVITDDDADIPDDPDPRRLPSSSRRYRMPAPMREYKIPFDDGTCMRVSERELSTMPREYQEAATRITSQTAAPIPKPKRQPNPKRPVQDESIIYAGSARTYAGETDEVPRHNRRRLPRFHWLVWGGLIVLLMVVGWYGFTILGNWWSIRVDDWQYGRPRTYQADANVGHGTAHNPGSHFIAQNLNRRIMVIEEPGDDPSKSKIYVGPTLIGKGQELTPVTLSFEDVNTDGRADLVIHLGDGKVVFLNQNDGTFTPAPTQ